MTGENPEAKLVLVVEDEIMIKEMLLQILSLSGYRIEWAENGLVAMDKVKARIPDVIILDVMMPKMDGWEVCRRLKSSPETRKIPIVMYTTLSDKSNYDKGRQLGVNGYVTKDKSAIEVLAAVRNIVGA